MRRILLFVLTNILVLTMIFIVVRLFGLDGFLTTQGLNLPGLLVFSAVLGFGGAFISLAISKWMAKMAMGVRTFTPQTATTAEERWLVDTVYALSRKAGLPKMPEVGIYESDEVNAFATGPSRSNSLVAVSRGLLRSMTQDEVEGVLAHEVAHVANGDMVTMTLLQGVINTFVIFLSRIVAWIASRFVREEMAMPVYFLVAIVTQIVFGLLGSLVVMGFSRYREYRADAGGAALSSRDKMIAALERLRMNKDRVDTSQPALQTMKISGGSALLALFASHPPLEDRIARLRRGA